MVILVDQKMVALKISIIAVCLTCFYVSAVVTEESGSPFPALPDSSPEPPANLPGLLDVTEFGAVADGIQENSLEFIAAWDAACSHAGNSTFYIPEGTFLLGPITFNGPCYNNQPPNVEIRGNLLASPDLSDFPDGYWILFKDMQGLKLTGGNEEVKIDAQGEEAWEKNNCDKSEKCIDLITSLIFQNVSYGTISNITVTNSKGFHVSFNGCDNVEIRHVNITAPGDSPNTDGIHVSKSTNINITSSDIGVGDDCVSIGPGSINVSVLNVNCGPGHGISVGSLGKYQEEKDVAGINVRNCKINGTTNGVRVKTWPGSPQSKAYNLTFEDIVIVNVSNPIIIDQEYCPLHNCQTYEPSQVKLSDIYFKNISGTYKTPAAVNLICSIDVPCENIQLVDIDLDIVGKVTPVPGGCVVDSAITGLEIRNSSISCNLTSTLGPSV